VPLSCNLGTLTSQESSGPVQACNGTALPFTLDVQTDIRLTLCTLGQGLDYRVGSGREGGGEVAITI